MAKDFNIVESYNDSNKFFIFRKDGVEVECNITRNEKMNNLIISPFKYKLTNEERTAIKNHFNNISKVNITNEKRNS